MRRLALVALTAALGACSPVCGSTPAAALGDACLAGRWVDQGETAPGNWTWNNEVIAVSGMRGLVITYAAGGQETDDYASAAPLTADYHGHRITFQLRGRLTYRIHASAGRIVQSQAAGSITATDYFDGTPEPGGTASAPAQTYSYRCSGTALHLESPATHGGYGPQVDELTR